MSGTTGMQDRQVPLEGRAEARALAAVHVDDLQAQHGLAEGVPVEAVLKRKSPQAT